MSGTLMLTDTPRALKELTGNATTYQRLYRSVVDGSIPAEKNRGGRWFVNRSDLPAIAIVLGLSKESK